MSAVKTDYYDLLGVPRDADAETIRKAFHALARECHPDVSASPEGEARFRRLAEAYGVLSKPASRLLYDRYGYRGRGNAGFDEALWEVRQQAARGESVHVGIELKPYEARRGTRRLVEFEATAVCPDCEGRGTTAQPDPDCQACGGTGRRRRVSHLDVARILQIEACPACGGEPCATCGGTGRVHVQRRLRVRIPGGIDDGEQLRVAGEGSAPDNGGILGDLLVDVLVQPAPRDPRFVRYTSLALFLGAVGALVISLR